MQQIFPYFLQLQIFQQDEYDGKKFFHWILRHFFVRKIENKKPLIWTARAKLLFSLAILLAISIIMLWTKVSGVAGFLAGIILATQPYIYLLLANTLVAPYERQQKEKIKKITEAKILSFKKLKVIGITGSYGKTSTKEFLYHILKNKFHVLRTPGSYNTPLGIAQVVDLELDDSYTYFICEMGAYKKGDIAEICDMVHPTYGMLTGINEQHLETFGSLQNTTQAKFELIASLPKNGFGVVNGDNALITNALPNYQQKIMQYGFSDTLFSIRNIAQTHEGSSFTLILDGKKYKAQTTLLGKSNLQNILGAATMSYLLGMTPAEIVKGIATLQAVPHRLEIKKMPSMTIIDDAYNSNVDGFQEAIALLTSFTSAKILVTPGIVDLGNQTVAIHESLGKLLDGVDHIFLVGESDRTKGLEKGIQNKKKIEKIASIKQVWGAIEKLQLKNPVVLLENDLPDNY